MSNIGTVQLRCFRRPGETRRVRCRTIARRVCPGGSYCVPVRSRDWLSEGLVDFQYGVRGSATVDLDENWHHLSARFSAIWIRYYDSGDDHDRFKAHGAACTVRRGAYYAFDQLEVELSDATRVELGDGSRSTVALAHAHQPCRDACEGAVDRNLCPLRLGSRWFALGPF